MKFCIICNLHFGVSGGFFQGAKLRTLVYVILFDQPPNEDLHFTVYFLIICQVDLFMTKVGLFDAHGGPF